MTQQESAPAEKLWHAVLSGEFNTRSQRRRRMFRALPTDPRCRLCLRPFRGPGGLAMRIVMDARPSQLNPNLCNLCAEFAASNEGVVEVGLSMLFADVRGSTSLAETISPIAFTQLINRFYTVATEVLVKHDALIEKLVGDEVTGLFVPGFTGSDHAAKAVTAARELLHVTGHEGSSEPWVPVGVGVHTGRAHVGSVGSKESGMTDIVALGDDVNTAARLASHAAAGEIVLSEATIAAVGLDPDAHEKRVLDLKGKSDPFPVRVINIGRQSASG